MLIVAIYFSRISFDTTPQKCCIVWAMAISPIVKKKNAYFSFLKLLTDNINILF